MRTRGYAVLVVVVGCLLWTGSPALGSHGTADGQLNATHLSNSPPTTTDTNSDLAFWGRDVYAGNYEGFRIIDATNPTAPQQVLDYKCIGLQNDVSVWDTGDRRLLFVSVDLAEPTENCEDGAGGSVPPLNPNLENANGFEGIRVFDVTDPSSPQYLRAVFTDCGSHTNTVLPVRKGSDGEYAIDRANPDRVFIYVSSYALAAVGEPRCPDLSDPVPLNDPSHNKISIVEVPFDAPETADVLKELPLNISTLGFPAQDSRGCHDIGVFLEIELAAAACQGEGQIWDISDPANPGLQDAQRIFNENINYFHSATFTWDGTHVIFGDEEGGAAITHGCLNAPAQPIGTGGTWFYDRSELTSSPYLGQATGSFIQDREQLTSAGLICTAHNYNVIPVSDRYLMASAYYEAGTAVLDFTDIDAIEEIAYFDAGGVDTNPGASEANPDADTWSSYWYNGHIYANDIARGVDIFALTGEPAQMVAGARRLDRFNPQTQECLILDANDDGNSCDQTPAAPDDIVGDPDGPPAGDDPPAAGPVGDCTNVLKGDKLDNRLEGTSGSDRINGKRGSDRISGRAATDCLYGGSGDDDVSGGGGADEINPGRGTDRVRAGGGNDVINAMRGGRDEIDCGPGADVVVAHRERDEVASSCEKVIRRTRADFATATHLQSH